MVHAWVVDHKEALWTESLLTPSNIDRFLVMLHHLKVKGRLFLTKAMMPSPPPKSSYESIPKALWKCSHPTNTDTPSPAGERGALGGGVGSSPWLTNLKVLRLLPPNSCWCARLLQVLTTSRA